MDLAPLTLSCAYGLDLILGDPQWLPHPVRWLGWAIRQGEDRLRRWIRNEALAGWWLLVGIGGGTYVFVQILLWAAASVSPWARQAVEVGLLFFCLSTRDLAVESRPVYRALKGGRLPEARSKVAMIVGRDTNDLDEQEVVRATVETIGESAMDGIIAPLFYAMIGGAPLCCLYKAVNTLDSMVGYRSARYLKFGRAAARVDTWMNWIPARLTAGILALAAPWVGLSFRGALRAVFRDVLNRQENSLIPEAAIAGALGVRVGGINRYQGVEVMTPLMGDPNHPLGAEVIPQAIRLMIVASFIGFAAVLAVRWEIGTVLATGLGLR